MTGRGKIIQGYAERDAGDLKGETLETVTRRPGLSVAGSMTTRE